MNELIDKNGLSESQAIERYREKNYPKPALTADIVVFRKENSGIKLLLIKRGGHPYLGCWALPGGFANQNEPVEETAARELCEETGLEGLPMTMSGFYSAPGRDPRGWVVSAAFAALLEDGVYNAVADDDAVETCWFDVETCGGKLTLAGIENSALAFDHEKIIADAARTVGILL